MKTLILVLLVAVCGLLAGCGPKLDGKYVGNHGVTSLTFKSNGKVLINNVGAQGEVPYEINGDKININGMVTVLKKDGSFDLPMIGTFTKE